MASILGISALYHDSAAALVVDGEVVAALHEERLSRVKHTREMPLRAARACLDLGGVSPEDLTAVVFYERPFAKLERVLVELLRSFPKSPGYFARALRQQLAVKLWVLDSLSENLGVERKKVRAVAHHESHAASAFFTSPFERAAVLTVDGVGEHTTTAIWHGEGSKLRECFSVPFPHSLGLLYAAVTAWLGFKVLEGELKVMALAAFGEPKLGEAFSRVIQLADDGSFELDPGYFANFGDSELGYGPALVELLGPPRKYGLPWRLDRNDADRHHADVAASLQSVTEEALLGLARRAKKETMCDALCLAGGVSLNCVATRRIAEEAGFSRVFVQPAAGDAGGALGAAILGSLAEGDPRPRPMMSAALGRPIDPLAGAELAEQLGLRVRHVNDPSRITAELLAQNKIVALASGREEWGPRALGFRSLLSPAQDARFAQRINKRIKRREPFRPFAASMSTEQARSFFDPVHEDLTRFMTTVSIAQNTEHLEGVLHVDGTSRLHTVDEASSPTLRAILDEYQELSGEPALLNTSLNGPGQPIAGSADDAIALLAAEPGVDALVLEDMIIERPS